MNNPDKQVAICLAAFVWTSVVVVAWALARWFGAVEPIQTMLQGIVILNIPLIGLFTLFKDGSFRYRVTENTFLNAVFWLGWIVALIVGVVTIVEGVLAA